MILAVLISDSNDNEKIFNADVDASLSEILTTIRRHFPGYRFQESWVSEF